MNVEPSEPALRNGREGAGLPARNERAHVLVVVALVLTVAVVAATYWAEGRWLFLCLWAALAAGLLVALYLLRRRPPPTEAAVRNHRASAGIYRALAAGFGVSAALLLADAMFQALEGWNAGAVRNMARASSSAIFCGYVLYLARRARVAAERGTAQDA